LCVNAGLGVDGVADGRNLLFGHRRFSPLS
jgi:hypothetical protein